MNEIMQALDQLALLLQARLSAHFSNRDMDPQAYLDDMAENTSALSTFAPFSQTEQALLLIALVPHLQPNFFESVIQQYLPQGGDFAEFGGVKAGNHRGMLPTGETVLFLLAGRQLGKRLQIQKLFSEDGLLAREAALSLGEVKAGEPMMSGRLVLTQDWLDKTLLGRELQPRFSQDFPARRLQTNMKWEDAVLHPITREQINDISTGCSFNINLKQMPTLAVK
ncbi:hypothetical protein MKQ70_33985 [Chitinophaga sedimenti]|uniref:hypothetical protein n=1 Tax=Chitinophaga sedimenti TaxID=2033606 RepID=UPI0020051C76|nr:hypothetical protein [Chitinophaga sedimenti]MCK7559688.1 hypothetical protein [Chitinophaga sedimenti]